MKIRLLTLLALLIAFSIQGANWHPDILGDRYEARTVDQGTDYDGKVVSTIIRRLVPDTVPCGTRRAILYVHGFNDYFFNHEIGEEANAHGYDFYAVDLRKYGRSLLPGQSICKARSMREYFPDIDSALVEMRHAGITETVLMGHSTGGLITALFCAENPAAPVDRLILNSPFLDWNLGWMEHIIWAVDLWGDIFPNTPISQGDSKAYAESLLRKYHGEWDYNTQWKQEHSPDVTAGWVSAISAAQHTLHSGHHPIRIPILLMYSSQSINGSDWTPAHNRADGVLDVSDIRRYGLRLGPDVTPMRVVGGLHDLLLSNLPLRTLLYTRIFAWLSHP